MSTIVVTPPAAAALVAVQKPSQEVRPGSFTWTWQSTMPGITTLSPASNTCCHSWVTKKDLQELEFSASWKLQKNRQMGGNKPLKVILSSKHSHVSSYCNLHECSRPPGQASESTTNLHKMRPRLDLCWPLGIQRATPNQCPICCNQQCPNTPNLTR